LFLLLIIAGSKPDNDEGAPITAYCPPSEPNLAERGFDPTVNMESGELGVGMCVQL
jgi:hypothetical protein